MANAIFAPARAFLLLAGILAILLAACPHFRNMNSIEGQMLAYLV